MQAFDQTDVKQSHRYGSTDLVQVDNALQLYDLLTTVSHYHHMTCIQWHNINKHNYLNYVTEDLAVAHQ